MRVKKDPPTMEVVDTLLWGHLATTIETVKKADPFRALKMASNKM